MGTKRRHPSKEMEAFAMLVSSLETEMIDIDQTSGEGPQVEQI